MSIYEIVEHIVTSLRHSPSQLISSERSLGPGFASRCLTNKLIDVESSIPIPCECASILSVRAHQFTSSSSSLSLHSPSYTKPMAT